MLSQSLNQARFIKDEPADRAIEAAFEQTGHAGFFKDLGVFTYNFQQPPAHWPQSMMALWLDVSRSWSSEEQKELLAASTWANSYLPEILHLLGFYSLPYCYAAADGAKVLVKSEKILHNTPKRLSDTAGFVLDVLDKGAFEASGKGFVALFKTRLYGDARDGDAAGRQALPVSIQAASIGLLLLSVSPFGCAYSRSDTALCPGGRQGFVSSPRCASFPH